MSKKATEFQRKAMSRMYRGKEIFKPLNTGWIDENVACVREWVANIFFYRKDDTTIMIDAGYNYDRLAEYNKLAVKSLTLLEKKLKKRGLHFAAMELLHARLVRTSTCVDGCRCDYTICGEQDPYAKEHPEYRDEAGFRRNT